MEEITIWGYLRVSTRGQTIQGNKDAIILKAVNKGLNPVNIKWVEEIVTGKKHWRQRKLNDIVEQLKKNDVIITFELSRIGRSQLQIGEFISKILEIGAHIYFCTNDFVIDGSISSNAMLFALSLSAQIERELTKERTKVALENRRALGLHIGRPFGTKKLKLDHKLDEIKKLIDMGVRQKVIAEKYNVNPMTITTFIKRHGLKPSRMKKLNGAVDIGAVDIGV